MTVGQLIDVLKRFDAGDIVLVDGYDYGLCDVEKSEIREIRFEKNINNNSYAGPHVEVEEGEFFGVVIGRGKED